MKKALILTVFGLILSFSTVCGFASSDEKSIDSTQPTVTELTEAQFYEETAKLNGTTPEQERNATHFKELRNFELMNAKYEPHYRRVEWEDYLASTFFVKCKITSGMYLKIYSEGSFRQILEIQSSYVHPTGNLDIYTWNPASKNANITQQGASALFSATGTVEIEYTITNSAGVNFGASKDLTDVGFNLSLSGGASGSTKVTARKYHYIDKSFSVY